MNVLISGKGFELSPRLRDEVAQSITEAFRRFGSWIRGVRVFLADENGPKKGVDRSVHLIVEIKHFPLLVVKEKGTQWDGTLASATDRAVHSLSRRMDRVRSSSGRMSMAEAADIFESRT